MSWNEPGNGKNPWRGNGDRQPPNLDEVVKDLQKKLSGLFGGGRSGDGPSGGKIGAAGLLILLGIAAVVWGFAGLYTVDAAEQGIVLRLGQYRTTTMPGLRWRPFGIDTVEIVDTNEIADYRYQTVMLTSDENIVTIDLVVQFRRALPTNFLFNVSEAEDTLKDVAQSAIREVAGKNELDYILGTGRADIAQRTKVLMQETLDSYGTGIEVTTFNLQDANFPQQVQAAVEDAVKAREDKERQVLEAEAYRNDIIPRARGEVARRIRDAEAYRDQVVANAEGEAARFEKLLVEYEKAPEVTRQRLYLESVEEVLGRASKVLIDSDSSGNLMYLPIDKLLQGQSSRPMNSPQSGVGQSADMRSEGLSADRDRDLSRSRGDRK